MSLIQRDARLRQARWQALSTYAPQTHMGLGLAATQRVMRLFGGHVRFAGNSAGLTVTLAGRMSGADAD